MIDLSDGLYPKQTKPLEDRKLLLNTNGNLAWHGKLKKEYCSHDNLHLSEKGKKVILGNFRHHIHKVAASLIKNRKAEA